MKPKRKVFGRDLVLIAPNVMVVHPRCARFRVLQTRADHAAKVARVCDSRCRYNDSKTMPLTDAISERDWLNERDADGRF